MAALSHEELARRAEAYAEHGSARKAAEALGMGHSAFSDSIKRAAELGLMGTAPVLPGFAIKSVSSKADDGAWIKQTKAPGDIYAAPAGQSLKGQSVLTDAGNRVLMTWNKTDRDAVDKESFLRSIVDGMKDEIPRAEIIAPPVNFAASLLTQYTLTDAHLGALAWGEETGGGDYDLSIGEKLVVDWFAAAIAGSPASKRAVLAQLGDFLHHDSFKSVTPEHGHLLDADSRYPKMVRVAIRVLRRIMRMLLSKHELVHVVMSDANHDPAAAVWLREMFAVLYEDEPRVTVDTSPATYNVVEHGDVSLFYHHGHKRGIKDVDTVFVGKFRAIYGRTRFSYGHKGHKHSDELVTTNLMPVEQHATLSESDAYGSNWLSGRSAKAIHYHEKRGEVGRNIITPEMVADGILAANDNYKLEAAA